MSNLDYVRFENTYSDLLDCYENMDKVGELNEYEVRYREKLIDLCVEIAQSYGED